MLAFSACIRGSIKADQYHQSFILSQIALSGPAIALFVIFTITVLVFALLVALIVAVLGVVVFTVLAVGFALLFLLPTLFFTTLAASFMWAWLAGGYYLLKKFNQKDIPGIHKPLGDSLNLDALTGKGAPPGQSNGGAKEDGEKKEGDGGMNGAVKATGVDHPNPKKGIEMGKDAAKGDVPKLKEHAGAK